MGWGQAVEGAMGGGLWEEDARTSGRAKGTASVRPPEAERPRGKALTFPPGPPTSPSLPLAKEGCLCIALNKCPFRC